MKILSYITDFLFRNSSSQRMTGEEELQEAEKIADEMFEVEEEEVNTETCEICGKTFEGETAGQKKGGHKASAHYN